MIDTTTTYEQATEWAPPTEMIKTKPHSGCAHCGNTDQFERVNYLTWCLREARRLGGRIAKTTHVEDGKTFAVICVKVPVK